MKKLLIVFCAVLIAVAANATPPQLAPNPGNWNEGVQMFAPIPSHDRTYTNSTKIMKCYSTASLGQKSRIMIGFDARQAGTSTAVKGKLSKNRSTTNYEVTSGRDYAVADGVTSYCFQPFSTQTEVETNWRGM